MVEDDTEERQAEGSGYLILPEQGDDSAVAVGETDHPLTIAEQMVEIEKILREAGRNCDPYTSEPMYYRAQKALYRCVDVLRNFNDGN